MSTKKRVLIVIIVAILVGVVVFPMLPLEYRERITAILAHPLYYLGLGAGRHTHAPGVPFASPARTFGLGGSPHLCTHLGVFLGREPVAVGH